MNIKDCCKIGPYADDTVAVFTGETWEGVLNSTRAGFAWIKHWLDSFGLKLHISKRNYISYPLTAANRPQFETIEIDGLENEIKEV